MEDVDHYTKSRMLDISLLVFLNEKKEFFIPIIMKN